MADSDSPLSDAGPDFPPDAQITLALREVVQQTFKRNDLDNLTLKRVRAAVTKRLDLPEDFFKSDAKWRDRSKQIVTTEVDTLDQRSSGLASSPSKPVEQINAKSPVQKKVPAPAKPQRKRKSGDGERSLQTKRRKKTVVDSDDDGDASEEVEEKHLTNPSPARPLPQKQSKFKTAPLPNDELGPESDLSDVLDEAPTVKKKTEDASSKPKKQNNGRAKTSSKPNPKRKSDKTLTPQEEEMKRLQGQLVKCGVRKVWGKELAKFDSLRDKISHLKGMLKDVGMDGRFSEDKARQIKEEREFKADLEAIQEGEELWGKKEEEPRRRLARGLQDLQGLGDDEESD